MITGQFWLWLEGNPVEIGQLKENIWRLIPLSSLSIPVSGREQKSAARKLARFVFQQVWKTVRSNLLRKFLQQFARQEDQEWFLHMQMSLLYGEPVDFSRDLLGEHDSELRDALEEPADIFAYGMQVQQIRFIREGEDIAKALQKLADEKLLSLGKLRAVLFAATQEELELARTRRDMIGQLFETLDLMGYLKGPLSLFRKVFASPYMQAMEFVGLLVLEQRGYSQNVEIIQEALRTNLPVIKRGRAFHQALQQELPQVFKELLSFQHTGLLFAEGTQQEQDAYFEHLREVYRKHQEALDAFRNRHPELFEETQDVIPS